MYSVSYSAAGEPEALSDSQFFKRLFEKRSLSVDKHWLHLGPSELDTQMSIVTGLTAPEGKNEVINYHPYVAVLVERVLAALGLCDLLYKTPSPALSDDRIPDGCVYHKDDPLDARHIRVVVEVKVRTQKFSNENIGQLCSYLKTVLAENYGICTLCGLLTDGVRFLCVRATRVAGLGHSYEVSRMYSLARTDGIAYFLEFFRIALRAPFFCSADIEFDGVTLSGDRSVIAEGSTAAQCL